MREIKFRAWDKDHDEMYNWETIKSEFVMRDFENDSLTMMQYTGLKDKNGREIYEGDIVVHHFMVYQGHGNVGEDKETIIIKDIAKLPFDGSSIGCEVIGNIHEHPHLLKEE